MNFRRARSIVTAIWILGGLLFYLILVIQSLQDVYHDDTTKVWGWALPTMMPTLLLMVGVHAGEAINAPEDGRTVAPFFFVLAVLTSGSYIIATMLTLLLPPLSRTTSMPPLVLMERSNLWLGPLQGLAAVVFGVFYSHKKK